MLATALPPPLGKGGGIYLNPLTYGTRERGVKVWPKHAPHGQTLPAGGRLEPGGGGLRATAWL